MNDERSTPTGSHPRHGGRHAPPRGQRGVGGRIAMVAMLIGLVAAACTGGSPATPSPSEPPSAAGSSSVPAESAAPSMPPGESVVPQAAVDEAVADAADRAGVDPAEVTIVSVGTETWASGALGCPEPGFLYTDVLTPGYHIVVEAGGREYDYRAAERGPGDVRWCERPPTRD